MPGERKRKTMLPLKVSVTLSLDEPVLRGICRCEERENRSVSGCVTITLRRHIQKVESGEIGAEELELAVERNRGKKRNKTLSISSMQSWMRARFPSISTWCSKGIWLK